ncbi:hypothetical protein N9U05_00330, partial [bacterium]|nr:hypothetical protein [bacterium]
NKGKAQIESVVWCIAVCINTRSNELRLPGAATGADLHVPGGLYIHIYSHCLLPMKILLLPARAVL